MKYESLIVIGILLLAALILGSELKGYLPELLEPVRPKYEVVTL